VKRSGRFSDRRSAIGNHHAKAPLSRRALRGDLSHKVGISLIDHLLEILNSL
jgi:hypothetical protein